MSNNQFSIYAGPSLNILKEGSVDDLAWYSMWSPSIKSANYQVWVGFNIGMRLFKQEAVERVNFPLERNFYVLRMVLLKNLATKILRF